MDDRAGLGWLAAAAFLGALGASAFVGIMLANWLMRRAYEKRQEPDGG